MLERFFQLSQRGTTVWTEVRAGVVTFFSMAYIIVVQPAVLSAAGMDPGAVMTATCLSAALATVIMGLYANYPICQAPLMGENAFFAFTVVVGMKIGWQVALGAVFVSGVIFLAMTALRIRELIMDAVPATLRYAIAAGIGLFITLLGLHSGGIITGTGLKEPVLALGNLATPVPLITIAGLFITGGLWIRKVPGAILWGMICTTLASVAAGLIHFDHGLVGPVPSLAPTFLKLDIAGALTLPVLPVILIFLFMLTFDTIGTLIGVAEQAGLMEHGKLPRAGRALVSDAVGTVAGSLLGTSTVSSYIESATGVAEGGRTGLANMVTAGLFGLALFAGPLVSAVAGGVVVGGTALNPITAPVLILVGCLMATALGKIPWDQPSEGIPALLAVAGIPLTYNIAQGIAFGVVSFVILKVLGGRIREVSWLMALLAIILAAMLGAWHYLVRG